LLPPRHIVFHFPTTSYSGTPSFNVHTHTSSAHPTIGLRRA